MGNAHTHGTVGLVPLCYCHGQWPWLVSLGFSEFAFLLHCHKPLHQWRVGVVVGGKPRMEHTRAARSIWLCCLKHILHTNHYPPPLRMPRHLHGTCTAHTLHTHFTRISQAHAHTCNGARTERTHMTKDTHTHIHTLLYTLYWTAPYCTAPHGTAPHRTALHRIEPH
jgi:hypothetical protein